MGTPYTISPIVSLNPFRMSGVEFNSFRDIPVLPPLHGLFFCLNEAAVKKKNCAAVNQVQKT